jgi:hypothetical protein
MGAPEWPELRADSLLQVLNTQQNSIVETKHLLTECLKMLNSETRCDRFLNSGRERLLEEAHPGEFFRGLP